MSALVLVPRTSQVCPMPLPSPLLPAPSNMLSGAVTECKPDSSQAPPVYCCHHLNQLVQLPTGSTATCEAFTQRAHPPVTLSVHTHLPHVCFEASGF